MYQPRSMRPTGPGTPLTGFGDERRPVRTQDEIRADLADRARIAETKLAVVAPAAGEVAMSAQELHGAGPADAERVVATPVFEVAARLSVAAQTEVA